MTLDNVADLAFWDTPSSKLSSQSKSGDSRRIWRVRGDELRIEQTLDYEPVWLCPQRIS